MQNLLPWQGSREWSFQISRITLCSEVCAGWMFFFRRRPTRIPELTISIGFEALVEFFGLVPDE
jgi:hypothetical protein